MCRLLRSFFLILLLISPLFAGRIPMNFTYQQMVRQMKPYSGKSVKGVDNSTLKGKVMAGYQGWFNAKGDGSGRGWFHYSRRGRFEPGFCGIDLWPDLREMDEDEKFPTPFKYKDGRTAYLFSSYNEKTVVRHFKWMKEYGIDGVFVQRFGTEIHPNNPRGFHHVNKVLNSCLKGANLNGRVIAVMYDLSGLQRGETENIKEDWKLLVDKKKIRDDKAYLRHKGRPVVAVWGIGFHNRKYTLQECEKLIDFLKNDKKYGNNTVMVGVPFKWRSLGHDSINDKRLQRIILKSDIISPWSISRYDFVKEIYSIAVPEWKKDIAWCKKQGKDYLPVLFPGFSWHNMRGRRRKLDQIPRLKGAFLWKQYKALKKCKGEMVYQAMFDELDEGTAIFKCSNKVPTGKSPFLTYEGFPTDYYLWLTGQGGRLIRGEKLEKTAGKKLPGY